MSDKNCENKNRASKIAQGQGSDLGRPTVIQRRMVPRGALFKQLLEPVSQISIPMPMLSMLYPIGGFREKVGAERQNRLP